MIHLLICFTTPATTPLFFLAQSVITVIYNPDNRHSGSFTTPMVYRSRKSRKTLMRSALPSAVNRNGEASATPFLSPACFSTLRFLQKPSVFHRQNLPQIAPYVSGRVTCLSCRSKRHKSAHSGNRGLFMACYIFITKFSSEFSPSAMGSASLFSPGARNF